MINICLKTHVKILVIIKCIYFYVVIGVNYADVCKLRLLHSAIITFLCNLSRIFAI